MTNQEPKTRCSEAGFKHLWEEQDIYEVYDDELDMWYTDKCANCGLQRGLPTGYKYHNPESNEE